MAISRQKKLMVQKSAENPGESGLLPYVDIDSHSIFRAFEDVRILWSDLGYTGEQSQQKQ